MKSSPATPLPLLQGTVDVLILRAVAGAPMHGYGISLWVRERARDAIAIEDAALYQALHRLERKGFIESAWGVSETNRRARFYSIAKSGRLQLQREVSDLRRYFEALFLVLETP